MTVNYFFHQLYVIQAFNPQDYFKSRLTLLMISQAVVVLGEVARMTFVGFVLLLSMMRGWLHFSANGNGRSCSGAGYLKAIW